MGEDRMGTVGIDIAKRDFVAAYWTGTRSERLGTFPNTPEGFDQLQQAIVLLGWERIRLVLEPTAGYERPLAYFAHERDWQVCLPSPKRVKDWAEGMGRRAKTDRVDAGLLARYGEQADPTVWHPVEPMVAEMEELLARRQDLDQQLRQERNRLDALEKRPFVPSVVRESLRRVIQSLAEEQEAIEAAIETARKTSATLSTEEHRLRQLPGIGPKNGLPIAMLLFRFAALTQQKGTTKELTAYVGLDPQTYESGTSVRRRATISRKGDREVRRLLYMGALGALRGTNPLRVFYDRLVKRGKAKKAALVAAARKLLSWAWAVFRYKTDFDPQRVVSRSSAS
jgi:transposase